MNNKINEALKQFNREDLIDDGYERDLDSNIEVFLTIKQMIYYSQLQSNWNSLRECIKWQPIENYDRKKYDWVLVKYYDGDYECVPRVAEMRADGKWYDTENNEIIFKVKYFFDMQVLDKMNELEGKDNK